MAAGELRTKWCGRRRWGVVKLRRKKKKDVIGVIVYFQFACIKYQLLIDTLEKNLFVTIFRKIQRFPLQ